MDLDPSLHGTAMPIPAVQVHESVHSELGRSRAGTSCLDLIFLLSKNGAHEATKVDTVVVVEEKKERKLR